MLSEASSTWEEQAWEQACDDAYDLCMDMARRMSNDSLPECFEPKRQWVDAVAKELYAAALVDADERSQP